MLRSSVCGIVAVRYVCMDQPPTVGLTPPNDKVFPARGGIGSVRLPDEVGVCAVLQSDVAKLLDTVRLNPPVTQSCVFQLAKESRQLAQRE